MTVYVDELRTLPGGLERCRLLGTNLAELREFASLKLDLGPLWEQSGPPTHYNLRPAQRKVALRRGASEISRARVEEMVRT